jgi:hypothetical protein
VFHCSGNGASSSFTSYYTKNITLYIGDIADKDILKTCGLCPPSGPVCIENPNPVPNVSITNLASAGLNNDAIANISGEPRYYDAGLYTSKVYFKGTYGGGGYANGDAYLEIWTINIEIKSHFL